MRAARYHDRLDVRIEEIPEPRPGPGQVKIRVPFNGICGTDLTEFYAGPQLTPGSTPHATTGATRPVVLGHEFGGYVVDAGDDVEGLASGQLVTVEPTVVCGRCPSCLQGKSNLCDNLAFHGLNTGGGGLAEFVVIDRESVYALPHSFTPQQAALVEPMTVAHHAVCRTGATSGDTVVVHGGGPIGVGALLLLAHRGARVIVVEPSPGRRDALSGLGAAHVIDPTQADAVAEIRRLTDGQGAAASIDAAGVPASFHAGVAGTAKSGTFVIAGVHKKPVEFMPVMLFSEMSVTGSTAYCGNDFPSVIQAMSEGAFPTAGWVEEIALDDLVERGFERLQRGEATKILVRVSDS